MRRATQAILCVAATMFVERAESAWPKPRSLDTERLTAAGLRVVESERATLVTDLPASPEIDGLPKLIDLGVPQWGERFAVRKRQLEDWRLRIYLVGDESKFRSLGLWPKKSSDFPHGLSLGYEVWVHQQKADYYRRHLLLHEATHSFMSTLLGSCGPGWFMEGTAELCGTHAWDGDALRLAVMPASREAVADWGRLRLVRESVAAGKLLSLEAVRKIDNRAVLPTESYGWVWALCHFLDNHPAYRGRFRRMPGWVTRDDFDRRFKRTYARDRTRLEKEWRLFVSTLVYGHEIEREAIEFEDGSPLASGAARTAKIRSDQGWQASGVRVKAGQTYRISASGRFVIGQEPGGTPWPSEAGGITLEYHAGRPIGELLATIDRGPGAFIESAAIGLGSVYRPPTSGTLYLRMNDSPGRLSDNSGELAVTVAVD